MLVTSSVYVSAPYVTIRDPETRVRLALESIERWLEIAGRLKIVICDGSGYDFTDNVSERFPLAEIESINFKNDSEAVSSFGKGYGEGEIVKYALENSEYLKECEYFIKCTSKLWVSNFPEVLKHWNNVFQCEFVFENETSIRHIKPRRVDTRFYIVGKAFYVRHLRNSHEAVRDREGYYLEQSFNDAILQQGLHASRYLFPVAALVEGISGSVGEAYRPTPPGAVKRFKRVIKRLRVRLNHWLYKLRLIHLAINGFSM